MKDLAPYIYRQRLVIEGICDSIISDEQIKIYLSELSPRLGMITLANPITHKAPQFGRAGWIHRSTSGAHFYARDHPQPFFSIDIYTCKKFKTQTAIGFTKNFFDTIEIAWKEI